MKKIFLPVKNGTLVSQKYGEVGQTGFYITHYGIDYATGFGADIYATDDGKVVFAGTVTGYGNLVKIEHEWGFSLYGHNSDFRVRIGDKVQAGELIAISGYSGWVQPPGIDGSHSHFECRDLADRVFDQTNFLTTNLSEVQMITYADVDRCFWAITRQAPNAEAYRHYVDSGEFTGSKVDMWADVADSPQHTIMYDQAQLYINGGVSGYEEVTEKLYRKK
ncbi:MAG: M23 family metallopeptidase [Candidatus Paceibacterota bacterium]